MNPRDLEQLIDTNFRFVGWLRKNFPDVKDSVLESCFYGSFGKLVRATATLIWSHVGEQNYAVLTKTGRAEKPSSTGS